MNYLPHQLTLSGIVLLASCFSVGAVRRVHGRIRRPIDALMGAALVGLGARMAAGR